MAAYTSTSVVIIPADTSVAAGTSHIGTVLDLGASSAATAPNGGRIYLRLANAASAPTAVPRLTVLAHSSLSATPPVAPTSIDGGNGWYVVHQFRGSLIASRVTPSVFDVKMGPRYLCAVVAEHTGNAVLASAVGNLVSF